MSDQNNHNSNEASQQLTSIDLKTKRDEYTEAVRKQKREEKLHNNRDKIIANENMNRMEEESSLVNNKEEENRSLAEMEKQLKGNSFSQTDLPELVQAAGSADKLRQLYGLTGLNRVGHTNIQFIIDANLVGVLIKLMSNYDHPILQRDAANLIQIISSGTNQHIEALIDKGVLSCLFELLTCEKEDTLEHVLMALGNFAGEGSLCRDIVLKRHGLSPILDTLNKATSPEIIKLGTWAVSNVCRGRPLPDIKLVEQAIPTLSAIFQREQDIEILRDSAWALGYLADTRALKVLETGIIPKLVHCLDTQDVNFLTPCIRILGRLFALPEKQNNIMLYGPDFLPKLFTILQNTRRVIRREACWLLSNIVSESSGANSIFKNPHYIEVLIGIAKKDFLEVCYEIILVLLAVSKHIDKSKASELIDLGVLDCFIYHLDSAETRIIHAALEGILHLLTLGQAQAEETNDENEPLIMFNNKGGTSKLEGLQTHQDDQVYTMAYKILETFYEEQDDVLLNELC